MNKDFWKGKRVFVTGHTGFKGSWLIKTLSILGADVSGYSNEIPTKPSMFEDLNLSRVLKHDYRGDIRDLATLKKALEESCPEIIFHLAAQPLVRKSYKDPIETYEVNVMGTLNVLMAAQEVSGLKCIVNITTDKCYENNEWAWPYREIDHLGGHDPYSSSKACVEILSSSIRKSFLEKKGINLCTVRAGNVIGGGDWAEDRIIPDFARAFATSEALKIRNPGAIRPWQHVMEPIRGYILMAEHLFVDEKYATAWNFGPESSDCISVEQVIDSLLSHWTNHPGYKVQKEENMVHEANILKLDCSKVKDQLKWSPVLPLSESLKLTAEWYQDYFAKKDLETRTVNQINIFIGQ